MHLHMANNYTSLHIIADKLMRHPLMNSISFEAIIDYAVDFMRIVQCGGFFGEKCETIDIKEYAGVLPEDFFEVNQIRLLKASIRKPIIEEHVVTNDDGGEIIVSTPKLDEEGNLMYIETEDLKNKVFTYTTDTFHMSDNKSHVGLTYKIQGGNIFTSIKEGTIELSYKAILVDEDGYPLIPDNSKFTRALQAYIKKEWFTILFDMGKLQPAILNNTQQEYAWAVGACESEFQKMSLDKAEAFYNSWRTMIPRTTQHSRGFAYDGIKQNLKIS